MCATRLEFSAADALVATLSPPSALAGGNGASPPPALAVGTGEGHATDPGTFMRIGQLTRVLHDALRELGYDRKIEEAASGLPDAEDRLAYVAALTGQAAERVLEAVESAQSLQRNLAQEADELATRLAAVTSLEPAGAATLTGDMHAFVRKVSEQSAIQNQHLTDIMLAQDFHDLTGQVLKRISELTRTLQANLVQLLLESRPPDWKRAEEPTLSGPVTHDDGRGEVVSGQAQVDDLLESLGF